MKISVWARSGATPSVRGIHCSKTTSKAPEPVCCCMVVAGAQSRKIFICPRNVGTRSCSRPGFHLGAPRLAITNQLDATSRARARLSSVDSDWLGALGQASSQGRSKAVQPASGSLTSRFELVRRLRIDAASPRHAWGYPPDRRAGRRAPRRDIRPFYLCCPEPGPWPDTAADSGGSVPGTDHTMSLGAT